MLGQSYGRAAVFVALFFPLSYEFLCKLRTDAELLDSRGSRTALIHTGRHFTVSNYFGRPVVARSTCTSKQLGLFVARCRMGSASHRLQQYVVFGSGRVPL